MPAEIDNKRMEETMRMILKNQTKFKDHRDVARAADNIGRSDVGDWIRANAYKFHIWIDIYSGVYSVPELEERWE